MYVCRLSMNYPPGITEKVGSFPMFCSRNSGLVFSRVAEYRVFLGHTDKLPSLHCFSPINEARDFLQTVDENDYHFVHLVVLVEQNDFYLADDCKGTLYCKDKRYRYFRGHRYCEWDLGYFENHQETPRLQLF